LDSNQAMCADANHTGFEFKWFEWFQYLINKKKEATLLPMTNIFGSLNTARHCNVMTPS